MIDLPLTTLIRNKNILKGIYQFTLNLYYSEKYIELISFIIWEIKYKIGVFPKIVFLNRDALAKANKDDLNYETSHSDFHISKSNVNWELVFKDSYKNLWGCIIDQNKELIKCSTQGVSLAKYQFDSKIDGLYISNSDDVFICSNGVLYKLTKNSVSFKKVLKFSHERVRFLIDTVTETIDGQIFIGEYASIVVGNKFQFAGYIYSSIDGGDSWEKFDFLKKERINKHVHIIKWSNLINGLILTDGDNQKNLWFNKSKKEFNNISINPDLGWKKINRHHIDKGGHTAITEINNKILFGTDYQNGTNFLISTTDMIRFSAKVIPSQYRRSIFDRMILRKNNKGDTEIWANLLNLYNPKVKSLLMVSFDNGQSWLKVYEYNGVDFEIRIISNSTTIDREIYLLVNQKETKYSQTIRVNSDKTL